MTHELSDVTLTTLCDLCSKLNLQRMANPILPCRDPFPCSTPPIDGYQTADFVLGTVDEVKGRRLICAICKLVAECLDKEPPDLGGECRFREIAEYCNFKLPSKVKVRDPAVTHFHFTQVSVIFDTEAAKGFLGPSLPWDMKERDDRSSHYIMNIQARARSGLQTGDRVTVAPQTEQGFLDAIGGRYVGPQVNAQLVQKWLHDCESKHGEQCQHSLQLQVAQEKAPSFVVDVVQWCLVDTPSQYCRYVALSYVWGTAPVFRHLLENSEALRKPNSLRSFPIPATIRDATVLVHAVGERYLWVDSICIVQDDFQMQHGEIMRMGSIYSNALFTIVAAAGDHANSGLPGVEPGSRKQVQKILKLGESEFLTVIDVRKSKSTIDDTFWAQRAWTFQERIMSSRLLIFSKNQVYWSCRAETHSEERALEGVEDILHLDSSFPQKPSNDLPPEPLPRDEYCRLYDNLIESYRERHLSHQTDILDAFNGVTEMLGGIQNDTFLWGLSESQFSHAMIWDLYGGRCFRNHIEVPILKSDGSKEMVPIPSWSWAAWSAESWVHYRNFMDLYRNVVRPAIQFYLVDKERKLVRIKEQLWQDHAGNRALASWEGAQPDPLPSLSPNSSKIGQLYFWTSHARVKTMRTWILGGRTKGYTLLTSPNLQPDLNAVPDRPEIIDQDFIVVAARGTGVTLILLAIEWKDGVAYRVAKTEVSETEWLEVKNRQWRLIMLG